MNLKRWSYAIGITMVGIMVLSAITPLLRQNVTTPQQAVEPTAAPTLPPPPDTSTIRFDTTYLHPSGLFTVAEPTGFEASQPLTNADDVRAVFSNTAAQGLIQVDINQLLTESEEPVTLDSVDALYNEAWLRSSWREYTTWEESSRERTENDELVIDFALSSRGQTYVARQKAWTDGEWIYSVRVVMPENATQALLYLLDGVAATLKPQKEFAGTPFNWNAYFDQQDAHIIRYPATWTLADSAPGKPASIEGTGSTFLRVESEAGTVIDSEEAATSWVEDLRSGVNILSVEPVTREGGEGYAVSYAYQNVDGDTESGLVVLLNGPEDKLHVANLRFPGEVDLNAEEIDAQYSDLRSVMNTFAIMPDLLGAETTVAAGS